MTKLLPVLQEWIYLCHTVIIITGHYNLLICAPSFSGKKKVIFVL